MTGSHEVKSSNLSVSTKTRLLATVFFCITKKALQAKCFFHRFYTCEHSEPADRCLLPAVRNANLQFISAFKGSGNGHLIGILKVGADGDTVSEPCHLIAEGL